MVVEVFVGLWLLLLRLWWLGGGWVAWGSHGAEQEENKAVLILRITQGAGSKELLIVSSSSMP